MIIYPAMDILEGQCVRLKQGDYQDVTYYAIDPVERAAFFREQGASWLHLVDLTAAKNGYTELGPLLEKIMATTSLKIEYGGGIRDMKSIQLLLETYQLPRIILGTAAIKNPRLAYEALARYGGDRVAIGLDARDNQVFSDGWTENSQQNVLDIAKEMKRHGAEIIIFTDIAKDGMLSGPNIQATENLRQETGLSIILSGGVTSLEDIAEAKKIGCVGAIVGKALYENKVQLKDCLSVAANG